MKDKTLLKINNDTKVILTHHQPHLLTTDMLDSGFLVDKEDIERPDVPDGKKAVMYYTPKDGVEWKFEDVETEE